MRAHVERIQASESNAFYIEDVMQHLRVSAPEEGFAVQTIGRTAAAEIEHFAQIALLSQTIRVTLFNPDFPDGIYHLPVGPMLSASSLMVTCDGTALSGFDVMTGIRPMIVWPDGPPVHFGRRLQITYEAGFGDKPSDVPSDLRQALMDQAALHYDGRSPMDAKSLATSPHMARISARYRGVSV